YDSELNDYYENPDAAHDGFWYRMIGNAFYGTLRFYDYTPYYWNLGPNDRLTIEWPDATNITGFIHNPSIPTDISNTITGKITPRWIEPIPPEVQSNMQFDFANNSIVMTGPFDALSWSQNTDGARELSENWSRICSPPKIPHGCPWIEFVVNNDANQPPVAAISNVGIAHTTSIMTLNGSSSWDPDGNIVAYDWDFGDGSPHGSGSIVTHTWTAIGDYPLTLTVFDDSNSSSTDSLIVHVTLNLPPVAVITQPLLGYPGENTLLDGSGSYDLDGTIVNYTWDFGDGKIGYGETVEHKYFEIGRYLVNLTVKDDVDALDFDTEYLVIDIKSPIAKIMMQDRAVVGEAVSLDGSASFTLDSMRTIVNYSWDFGDGTTGYGISPTHSWLSADTYPVSLIVRDDVGNNSLPFIVILNVVNSTASAISVSVERHSLFPLENTNMIISVVDAAGNIVTGFTGNVTINCNQSIGVNLPAYYDFAPLDLGTHTFDNISFDNPNSYLISAYVNLDPTINGTDFITVSERSVEFRVYNIFQYPLYDHWLRREWYYAGGDEPYKQTSPTVQIYRSWPANYMTEAQLLTTYRINMSARNVQEITITNPTFIPRMNPAAGTTGSAHYDVAYQYQSDAQMWDLYQEGKITFGQYNANDGWEYYITGNLTMDRTAAAHLIDLPVSEADVPAWWSINNYTIGYDNWEWIWWTNESGFSSDSGRLDIRASDDGYPINQGYFNSEFWLQEWADGSVSLKFWRIGYGEDILLMRQLYWGGESYGNVYPNGTPYGLLPMECWLEDLNMSLDIHETNSNVTLDAGVVYGWRAWKSDVAPDNTPVWRWEIIRSDYMPTDPMVSKSEMSIYSDRNLKYLRWDPGSSSYGSWDDFDYVPAVWDMVLGESLVIEKPACLAVGYLPKPMIGDYTELAIGPDYGGYYDSLMKLERYGYASIHAVGAPTGSSIIDSHTGDLRIVGPFYPDTVTVPEHPWLVYEPAPRIELWIEPMETHAPVASFEVTPSSGNMTRTFEFDASDCSDVENIVDDLEVRWDWEDDGTWDTSWSTIKTAQHQYSSIANYTIRLQVRDLDNITSETTRTAEVFDASPVALFTVIPVFGDLTTVFEVNASMSWDLEDPPAALMFRWDWDGDGTWDTLWSSSRTANYTYPAIGNYTIKMLVMDLNGTSNITTQQVTVVEIIPEFQTLIIPILGTLGIIFAVASRRRIRR
ncbi:MAG: PKD domain-containing protein, partial [Thermoplasmata archaeon]|nr:PKD domain-containing protein [Thermoplasmata archaeon]